MGSLENPLPFFLFNVPIMGPAPPDGDRHGGADIIISQFVLMGIATVLICLRLLVRAKMTRKMGWDDFTITWALIITTIGLGFNCKMVQEGFGRHLYYLKHTPAVIPRATYWHIIWQPTFFLSVTLTRISICLLLLHIFGVNRHWRWGLWAIMALIITIFIPSFVMLFTQCIPYEKSTLKGHCVPASYNVKAALYSGIMAVIQDWFLATIPIVFLWNMHMGLKQKAGICALMSLGYFSGICALVRTVISMRVFKNGGLADFSWVIIDLRTWGITENLVGVIAASIPTLKPLYVKTLDSHYFSRSRKGSSKGYLAAGDGGPIQGQKKHIVPHPWSTGGKDDVASEPGIFDSKGRDTTEVRTDIELDQYSERRAIVSAV